MKNKGMIIELTSLLDVILIMLFWVMITSSDRAAQAENEAQKQIDDIREEYRQESQDKDIQIEQLDRYFSAVEGFEDGEMLTVSVTYSENEDVLSFSRRDEVLFSQTMDGLTDPETQLRLVLDGLTADRDGVILCAFVFDGSSALYRDVTAVKDAFESVRGDYENLYFTMVNTNPKI